MFLDSVYPGLLCIYTYKQLVYTGARSLTHYSNAQHQHIQELKCAGGDPDQMFSNEHCAAITNNTYYTI